MKLRISANAVAAFMTLILIIVLVVIPLVLSAAEIRPQSSPAVPTEEMKRIRDDIDKAKNERATVQADFANLKPHCAPALYAAFAHGVRIPKPPDCVRLIPGEPTGDAGLDNVQLAAVNAIIADLNRKLSEIADKDRRIAELDAAYAEATRRSIAQGNMWFMLWRYASLGAIGAIGFNLIRYLNVFGPAAGGDQPRQSTAGIVWHVNGSMIVGGILATIFVAIGSDTAAGIELGAFSLPGIAVSLAAGLVGDAALRTVRTFVEGRV